MFAMAKTLNPYLNQDREMRMILILLAGGHKDQTSKSNRAGSR